MEKKRLVGKEEILVFISSLFLMFSLIGILCFVKLDKKMFQLGVLVCFAVTLMINVILMSLIHRIRRVNEEKNQYKLEAQQKRMTERFQEETEGLYQELTDLKKDMDRHLESMQTLLEEQRYDDLKKYFMTVSEIMYENEKIFLTGNEIIDVVMSQKCTRALAKGIHIQCNIQSIELKHILDMDLCSLLSNVLDNAIEAVEQCEDKNIYLELKKNKNHFIIKEDNPYKRVAADKRKKLKTTKREEDIHGFGLKSMENKVKQYHGTMNYELKDNRFYIQLVIPDEEKE